MTKRVRSFVAVFAATVTIAAGCGNDSQRPADPTAVGATSDDQAVDTSGESSPETDALLIWVDEPQVEPVRTVGSRFTELTGVELVVEAVPFDEMRDRVARADAEGRGPDIFAGAHEWTGLLAAEGVIDPVDVRTMSDSFEAVALQGTNFEGRNYAIPYLTEAVAMYRNTDLVADAPQTWDDLRAACDAVAVANCVVMPGGGDTTDAYHNYPFGVSSFGGYVFAYDEATGFDARQVGLDTPEAIASGKFLEQQVAGGYISATDYDTAKSLWLDGEAAFWVTGPWELGAAREQTEVSNWDVSIIPQMGSAPAQPFVAVRGFFLSSSSERSLLAESFLTDFVATDDMMDALFAVDPLGTAWTAVRATLDRDPHVRTFDASAEHGVAIPNIPQMAAAWDPMGDNLLLIRNGEADATDALTAAADAVRSDVAG